MKKRSSRRVLSSLATTLGLGVVGWSVGGCIFFDVEHLRCKDDGTCELIGDGDGDGDGDLGSGGKMDGANGGSWIYPVGGGGGDESGGSGGDGDGDGTGGLGDGGTGGEGTGGLGTGGEGTGGEGTGGTPQVILDLQRDVRINELIHGSAAYVELHSKRTDEDIDLTGLYIIVENSGGGYNYPICSLSGGTLPMEGVLLVQSGTGPCYGGPSTCIKNCNLPIAADVTVSVYSGSGMPAEDYLIDSVTYPSKDFLPDGSSTVQACPNGSKTFKSSVQTAGELNTCN